MKKKTKKEDTQLGMTLTEVEALRWGKMDSDMRNDLQALRLVDYELDLLTRNYLEQKLVQETMKKRLIASIESRRIEYQELTKSLAEKYKVDLKRMVIDPDTGSIRELP